MGHIVVKLRLFALQGELTKENILELWNLTREELYASQSWRWFFVKSAQAPEKYQGNRSD